MITIARLALVFTILVAAAPALAQEEVKKAKAGASLVEFEEVMTAAGCQPAAIKDPKFVADAKNAIRPLIHDEDANAMLTNKKHVLYAYVALLVLFVAFIGFLFRRQTLLSNDIKRLEDELEKAVGEDGA